MIGADAELTAELDREEVPVVTLGADVLPPAGPVRAAADGLTAGKEMRGAGPFARRG